LNISYTFPDPSTPEGVNLTEEAKDLISKLLVRTPKLRLGAGRPGSSNDYTALKSHSYFAGIDFDKVFLMKSPI